MEKEANLLDILIKNSLKYWHLFTALAIISFISAYIYVKRITPTYEITARLIIKDEKKGVDDAQILESTTAFSSKKIVENEIEVIHSRALLKQVANKLKLHARIFEETEGYPTSAHTSSPIRIELEDPENLKSDTYIQEKYYFKFNQLKNVVEINNTNYPVNQWIDFPFGKLKFQPKDYKRSENKNQLYFTLVNPKLLVDELYNNLEVTPTSKLSTVVNIKFRDIDPIRGQEIVNKLIETYNEAAVLKRNKLAENTLNFIEKRIRLVEEDLNEVENKIEQFRSSRNVVDLSQQGRLFLEKVGDNDRRMTDLKMQISVLNKVEQYIINKNNKDGIVPSTLGIEDAMLTKLLERLYDAEIEYESLKRTTAVNNSSMLALSNEINKIRPSILENIKNQKANLNSNLKSLDKANGSYNKALQTIPSKERQLLEISRKKEIINELYKFLLQKREETALSYAPTNEESRIVDLAESSIRPVDPKKTLIYSIAFVLSISIGIAVVITKEVTTNTIKSKEEIKKYTNVPVIGELANTKKNKGESKDRIIKQQFKNIRIALNLYGYNNEKKKILITSSIKGEGKSYISDNLAKELARAGKRVLFVNFDLRKKHPTTINNSNTTLGMSEFLKGNVKIDEIIKKTEINNLYEILTGDTTTETIDDLLDISLNNFFKSLEIDFDYVIIDSPPLNIANDAYLISSYCDMILYAVRHEVTPKSLLEGLKQNKETNIFIILNAIKSKKLLAKEYSDRQKYMLSQSI